jgi:hypothetical protein
MRAQSLVAWSFALAALVAIGPAAGCERLLSIQDPVAGDQPGIDAAVDARLTDGGGLDGSSPILLSEIVVATSPAEMIEIVNTSGQEVDLSRYYLSDSEFYSQLPAGPVTVDMADFIVRFPDQTKIPGHGVITIAVDTPTMFATTYGQSPNFSLTDTSMDRVAVNGAPRLTDGGEPIILFQWDGQSDLVRDVDIMIVGKPSMANALPDKSGKSQDGIDADTTPSAYAADSNTIMTKLQGAAPGNNLSTKRLLLEDGHETHAGNGNGQSGDDETSEDIAITWDGGASSGAFGAPTPGAVPAALLR